MDFYDGEDTRKGCMSKVLIGDVIVIIGSIWGFVDNAGDDEIVGMIMRARLILVIGLT